jgi:ParB/RepB/Spo0J family partition protein
MVQVPVAAIEEEGLAAYRTPELAAEQARLEQDIRERGLLQPIIVAPAAVPGRYRILAGHKRFLACCRLGWKSVPVVVQEEPVRRPEPG